MSEWEREGLAADNASALWTCKTTPRFGLTIPLDLEEVIGRRWRGRRIAELEAERERAWRGAMSNPSGEDVLSARTSKSNYCPECTVPYGTLNDLESAERRIAALEALCERLRAALEKVGGVAWICGPLNIALREYEVGEEP